jgi:hypothetical protein
MLVLLGPPFDGTEDQYARLAEATGLLVYDLRTKLKPGSWGIVRVLGDALQASQLATRLETEGFRVCVVDPAIAHDPERRVVPVRGIALEDEQLVLQLRERSIPVPYRALVTIVRGEVQVGRPHSRAPSGSSSSAAIRAVAPSAADLALFRESTASGQFDAFVAADLHFQTVLWAARVEARNVDFAALGIATDSPAQDLEQLVETIAERAAVRIDRSARLSSLASFASRPPPMRSASPIPGAAPPSRASQPVSDERFDGYSRLVAEAERLTRRFIRASLPPPR